MEPKIKNKVAKPVAVKSKRASARKAPAKRRAPLKDAGSVVSAKPMAPVGLCVNCAPLGYTQVLAMLLVSVFSLVTILSVASAKIDAQADQIQRQAQQIESINAYK